MPTRERPACAIEFQNASTVWPDSVRPLRSVIVTEIITGSATPVLVEAPRRWRTGRLDVQRVEDGLGQQDVDAAVDQAAHLLVVGVAHLVEGDRRGTPGR